MLARTTITLFLLLRFFFLLIYYFLFLEIKMSHLFKVWDTRRENRVIILIKDEENIYEQLVLKGMYLNIICMHYNSLF